jgi:hypothetical protein
MDKVCNGPLCKGKEKSVNEFWKNKSGKDGFYSMCKECCQKRGKEYYQEHKKERKIYRRKHRHTLNGRYFTYKNTAKKRNLKFDLTLEQFEKITSQLCYYCREYTKDREFCGIDRVNSNFGYVLDNCVPCCETCNYMKRNLTTEEFLSHIKKILKESFHV